MAEEMNHAPRHAWCAEVESDRRPRRTMTNATRPAAVYGRKGAAPKKAYSFSFDTPEKGGAGARSGGAPAPGSDPFDFDESEPHTAPTRSIPTPTKRGAAPAADGKKDAPAPSHSQASASSRSSRGSNGQKSAVPAAKPASASAAEKPSKGARKTQDAKSAGTGTSLNRAPTLDAFDFPDDDDAGPAALRKPPPAKVPPAKALPVKATRQPARGKPKPREPSPDPEELDPWMRPDSSTNREHPPSQPSSPPARRTPKKPKPPSFTERLLSSPRSEGDDYFEVAYVPSRPASKSAPAVPMQSSGSAQVDDGSEDELSQPSQFSQASRGPKRNLFRDMPRPSDPFSLIDSLDAFSASEAADRKRAGLAKRMRDAVGREVDPLRDPPPEQDPELERSPKKRSPTKPPPAGRSAPPPRASPPGKLRAAEPEATGRDVEMQMAIRAVLSADDGGAGKAIVGISKMVGSLVGAESMLQGDEAVQQDSQESQPGVGSQQDGGQRSSQARGARTYGRGRGRGGMAGAASAPGPMDLAAVADMGREKEPQPAEDSDEDQRTRVQSKHALTHSGASRIFLDGIEYLLSGLREPLGPRRTASIELVRRLGNEAFRADVRLHGVGGRLVEAFVAQEDPIVLAGAAAVLAHLMTDRRIAEPLVAEEGCPALEIAVRCFKVQDPLAGWGGKAEKSKLKELKDVLSQPGTPWDPIRDELSLPALAVLSLDRILSHAHRDAATQLASLDGLGPLLSLLHLVSRVGKHASLFIAERALRALEAATMLHQDNQRTALEAPGALESVVSIMRAAEGAASDAALSNDEKRQATDTRIAALKSLVNLSNDHAPCALRLRGLGAIPPLMRAVLTPPTSDDPARAYDTVVLATGLLINLTGLDPQAGEEVRAVSIGSKGGIEGLVDLFRKGRVEKFVGGEGSAEDAERDRNVLLSYIALLLGCLVRHSDTCLATVRPLLPGGDLSSLRRQLEDFAAYQRAIVYAREGSGEHVAAGEQVERDVIEMVEILRERDGL
ncbi:hypothetical protein DFJ74DRAFT_85063 [Hyaloraphidium curvatum]|nr:hypothetical protein DFJ74DRAFT_85063 [Hyaloraphidium curvatum]